MKEAILHIHGSFHPLRVSPSLLRLWMHLVTGFLLSSYEEIRLPFMSHYFGRNQHECIKGDLTTFGVQLLSSNSTNRSLALSIWPSVQSPCIMIAYVTTAGFKPLLGIL